MKNIRRQTTLHECLCVWLAKSLFVLAALLWEFGGDELFFCGRDLECIFDKKKTLSMNLNRMNGVYLSCVFNKFINKFLNYQNIIIFSLSGKGRSSLNKMEYFYEPFFKLIVLS